MLVPIIDADKPSALLTQRTANLNDHAGQILFPGGTIDAIEENTTAAALSEGRGWLGKSLLLIEVKRPEEYSSGFEKMMQWRANAVAVIENPIFFANREKITSSAANSKLQQSITQEDVSNRAAS